MTAGGPGPTALRGAHEGMQTSGGADRGLVAREVLPAHFHPRTIPGLLKKWAVEEPTRRAIVGRSAGGDYRALTYGELLERSGSLAKGLRDDLGVRHGTAVASMLGNECGFEAMLLHHALLGLGAVHVPVNTRLTDWETSHMLDHAEAEVVVYGSHTAERLCSYLESKPDVGQIYVGDGPVPPRARSFASVPAGEPLGTFGEGVDPEDRSVILYTSGTTSLPKGVVHSHMSATSVGVSVADVFCMGRDDVLQAHFPIFTGGGLHFNGMAALWSGATWVIDDFDTVPSLKLVEQWGSTITVCVPSVYQFWLDSEEIDRTDVSSLRIVDYGGAAMAPALITRLRARFPDADLMQTYGLTEGGPSGVYLAAAYADRKLGSVGNRGFGPFTHFRVVDEDGRDVGPDEEGEFILRSPSIMLGYHRDPQQTAATIRDGWLYTGDIVRVDADGFLYHVDRKKDIIVRGGYNVASAEVEAALLAHDEVIECAVVAKPHPKLQEDIKAFVVRKPGGAVDAAGLTAFSRKYLADFKVPRDIEFVDELPKNSTGKVLKRVLRQRTSGAENQPGDTQ